MEFLKNNFRKLVKNQLIAGSFVMMVGSLTSGFGNYLYHLLMGRMLGPVDYGILASLIAISYLLNIPISTLNLVIVKFVSALKGQKKLGAVTALFKAIRQKILLYGLIALLLFYILTPLLVSFLHLKSILPLIIVGIIAFISVIAMVNRATLQGLLRFGYLSASNILEVTLKVGSAVLLVIWGFKVNGALFAFIVGVVAAYFFTLFALRFLPPARGKKSFNGQQMLTFAIPVFFSTLSFTSLFTTDIILARHFLEAQQAGFYAALAILGKIIYFVSLPVILVMFPMVSERHANGGRYRPLLLASLGLVGLACLGITTVYFLLPGLMVRILFGSAYLPAASYLGFFGIFLSLYSFSFLLVNFYLSVNRTKAVVFPIVASLTQIILISFFHASLLQVIKISILVTSLLLLSLMLYYYYDQAKASLSYHSRL